MALSLSNNFEGGTAGTTITTANSGGASGDAFDVVTIGTGVGLTADGTNPAHGAGLDMAIVQPATGATGYCQWDASLGTLSTNQTLYGRLYFAYTGATTGKVNLASALGGATGLVNVAITNLGAINITNVAGTKLGTGSTLTLSTNTLYRIEFSLAGIGGGTTAGTGQVNIYAGDSTSALDTACSASGVDFGSLAPTKFRFGNASAGWASQTMYFDAVNVNDTALPGPEIVAVPIAIANMTRRLRVQYR